MKNLHLIPINVIDIVDKLNNDGIRENEKMNYITRLEAIRDYCNTAINKHSRVVGEPTRGFALGNSKKKNK